MGDEIRISASQLPRLRHCQYWARPDVTLSDEPPSDAANLGSAFHDVMAWAFADQEIVITEERLGVVAADFQVPVADLRALVDAVKTSRPLDGLVKNPDAGVWTEIPLAYNPADGSGRQLETEGRREYVSLEDGEVPCTVDLIFTDEGADPPQVVVVDWKTGWGGYVEPASTNLQLRFNATSAAAWRGVGRAVAAFVYVAPDGCYVDATELRLLDFDAVRYEIRALQDKVADAEPVPGSRQCQWCAAAAECPASVKALTTLSPDLAPPAEFALVGPIKSVAEATYRLSLKKPLEAALDGYVRRLQDYARASGGIPTVNGKVWRESISHPERIDAGVPGTLDEIRKILGPVADDVIKTTVSISAIKKAVRSDAARVWYQANPSTVGRPPGVEDVPPAQVEAELMAKIRTLGAIKSGAPRSSFRELKIKLG